MMVETWWEGIRGVVLDAVGTLMDPEPSVAEAYAAAARRQGVELHARIVRDRFREHFGDDEIDEMRGPLATDEATEHRRWRRIVAGCLPEVADLERAFEELWDHFGRPESWRPYPEAGEAIRAMAGAGMAVVVGSNFDGRLRPVLRGLSELAPWADSAIISAEVGRRKPHPDFYRAACDRLGLPPEAVLCVGDDRENDLQGPQRAGLRAVLIDRSDRGPCHVPAVRSLKELADRLASARRRD